ncbi:MAG: DUF1566 domain-containing protein [Desulfobacterales bacterium]|nr:DUF1566 domain-containing protein [Desulfobacterales bacterium]
MNAKLILKAMGLLLCLVFIIVPVGLSGTAEKFYYSIHLDSFKKLEDANSRVNFLKTRGKLVFWKKTKVSAEDEFYRVYLGKYQNIEDAVAYWEKLKTVGEVNHFGIHIFEETFLPDEKKSDQNMMSYQANAVHHNNSSARQERFVDNQDGTVTDTIAGLMWIKNGWKLDFLSAVTWWDAVAKCKNFRQGGYSDWRLPTIEEWVSLIDTNYQNPALVEPNPFENIISHMPYWSKSDYIYSRNYNKSQQSPRSYAVMLYSGNVNHQDKKERAYVLPVRSIAVQKNPDRNHNLSKAFPTQ